MPVAASKMRQALDARTHRPVSSPALRTAKMLAAVVFSVAASCGDAVAAYRLQPGDTIEISIAGFPELRQNVSIQPDGTIAFPLLGALNVAGLSSADMRQAVQAHLARKIYRRYTTDGREILVVIRPEEVSATIVGYRPVYVSGDVAKPGEVTFRPGLTVREALALAGGYVQMPPLAPTVYLAAASVKAESDLLRLDLARQTARVARITSELNGEEDIRFPEATGSSVSPEQLEQMDGFETNLLKARLANDAHVQEFLGAVVQQDDKEIAVLSNQQKEEEAGAQSDQDDLKKLSDLLGRGQVTSNLVVAARRALLLSSTRTLQVMAQLLRLKKEKADSLHQRDRFKDHRKIALLTELADATQALNDVKVKLGASKEKLDYLAGVISHRQLGRDPQPEITLVRHVQKDVTHSTVDADFPLAPGDVIEVSLHSKSAGAVVSQ